MHTSPSPPHSRLVIHYGHVRCVSWREFNFEVSFWRTMFSSVHCWGYTCQHNCVCLTLIQISESPPLRVGLVGKVPFHTIMRRVRSHRHNRPLFSLAQSYFCCAALFASSSQRLYARPFEGARLRNLILWDSGRHTINLCGSIRGRQVPLQLTSVWYLPHRFTTSSYLATSITTWATSTMTMVLTFLVTMYVLYSLYSCTSICSMK
jgi:hypothetical protein